MEIANLRTARAARYRCAAGRLRQQADALGGSRERAELLAIADQYDRLADHVARGRTPAAEAA